MISLDDAWILHFLLKGFLLEIMLSAIQLIIETQELKWFVMKTKPTRETK